MTKEIAPERCNEISKYEIITDSSCFEKVDLPKDKKFIFKIKIRDQNTHNVIMFFVTQK